MRIKCKNRYICYYCITNLADNKIGTWKINGSCSYVIINGIKFDGYVKIRICQATKLSSTSNLLSIHTQYTKCSYVKC